MNTDYQKQINEANARGDYATAKNLEAIRNAKINYMNSIGVNKDGWTATNNYNFNSFSDLPSNWTSANIGGNNYINQDGRYYDSENNFLGTGWNANTGSFTYNNRQDEMCIRDRSYLFGSKNNESSSDLALSTVGGSPGRSFL